MLVQAIAVFLLAVLIFFRTTATKLLLLISYFITFTFIQPDNIYIVPKTHGINTPTHKHRKGGKKEKSSLNVTQNADVNNNNNTLQTMKSFNVVNEGGELATGHNDKNIYLAPRAFHRRNVKEYIQKVKPWADLPNTDNRHDQYRSNSAVPNLEPIFEDGTKSHLKSTLVPKSSSLRNNMKREFKFSEAEYAGHLELKDQLLTFTTNMHPNDVTTGNASWPHDYEMADVISMKFNAMQVWDHSSQIKMQIDCSKTNGTFHQEEVLCL